MKVAQRLKWLADRGCFPSIYYRGDGWRAHINASGNMWSDGDTLEDALEGAVALWKKRGKPKDGRAA